MAQKSEFLSAFGIAFQIWKALVDEVRNLGGGDEQIRRIETDGELRKKIAALIVAQPPLLKFVTTAKVDGVARFAVKDHFAVDTSETASVKFAYLDYNFKANFLGKVEENVPAAELKVHRLTRNSFDAPILAELGDRAETTLAHFFALLAKQGKGEAGQLLTNGCANIFYVRDAKGVLWAVGAGWHGSGWSVDASSVEDPGGWNAGNQVFSR